MALGSIGKCAPEHFQNVLSDFEGIEQTREIRGANGRGSFDYWREMAGIHLCQLKLALNVGKLAITLKPAA